MSCLSREQMQRMLDAISGYCGPAPESVKVHTIGHAVERFCSDMGGIMMFLGPVAMKKPDGIYYAVAPFGGVVYDVRDVRIDGVPLVSDAYRVQYTDDGRARIAISRQAPDSLLAMSVLWRPGERTTQMPAQWFDKNFDVLMHGCIAAVLSQVGTAWGNPDLAKQFESEYARDVHDAICESRIVENRNGQLSCLDPNQHWI